MVKIISGGSERQKRMVHTSEVYGLREWDKTTVGL